MPPAKPLKVEILRRNLDSFIEEEDWEPYQEYGAKVKTSTNNWSCYILAKEGELFAVRCANTTENLLAVRISADACYVQQYLLRPAGTTGDTLTCHGTGSHTMVFRLVSALTRAGTKHSRPPSETGSINVTVYEISLIGSGLTLPEKPTEQLELPVSMDGTFWKLCVRLAGGEMVISQPSPHAAEINTLGWRPIASLEFNYRTEEELFSGRIRGFEIPPKHRTSVDTNTLSSAAKRKRESTGDDTPKKRRDHPTPGTIWKKYTPPIAKIRNFAPSTPSQPEDSPSPAPSGVLGRYFSVSYKGTANPNKPPSSGESLSTSRSNEDAAMALSDKSPVTDLEPPLLQWPLDPVPRTGPPNTSDSLPQQPPGQPSQESPVVVPAITPPPSPHDNPELAKHTAESPNNDGRTISPFVTFLDEVSPHRPIRFLENELQAAGISSLAELKIVARRPEVFRAKIPALATLREHDQYLWMKLKKKLVELPKGDHTERPSDSVVEDDPVRRFISSLGAGGCINTEWLAESLRGAGISSQKDLLVLSRNLERYVESIPSLQTFATSNQFGWAIFQVGLEGLPGRRTTPTFTQTRNPGADMEGCAYIKHFLDTIDSDKPLGYLADGFIDAGLTARFTLLDVAEDIKFAVEAMPFLQDLASGDQFIWAMIVIGLENLLKST